VDVDLTQDALAGVNESMRCIRGNDNNAACLHLAFFISDRDRGSFDGERDFYVGMLVQRRALPGFGRDDVGEKGAPSFSPTNSCDIPTKGSCSRLRKLIEEIYEKASGIRFIPSNVFSPIPSASVAMAMKLNPGDFSSMRSA
jgi:hypothetical protein